MITQFSGWKATDGTFHTTRSDAEKHERIQAFKTWCETNICRGGEWSAEMVAEEILANWHVTSKTEAVATQA